MSYSAMYRVSRTTATMLTEYRNGWGSGPLLWGILSRDFLGSDDWLVSDEGRTRLWALAKDPAVPLPLRIAHAFTFDRAIVRWEDREKMVSACETVYGLGHERRPTHANHWGALAEFFDDLKKPTHPKTLGFGLNCTSVSDVWSDFNWKRGVGQPPWDCIAAVSEPCPPSKTQNSDNEIK